MPTHAAGDFERQVLPQDSPGAIGLAATDASENTSELEQWSVTTEKGLDWTVDYDANGTMVTRVDNATSETKTIEWDAEGAVVAR